MLGASLFGLFGVVVVCWLIMVHLLSLKSFGVPYLAPWAPLKLGDLKDSLVRLPLEVFRRRPSIYGSADKERQRPIQSDQKGTQDDA